MASYRVDFSEVSYPDDKNFDLSIEIVLEFNWSFLQNEFIDTALVSDPDSLDPKILRKTSLINKFMLYIEYILGT